MKNSILDTENDVAARIAQRTVAKREAGYASEVRRLLDAALEVMRQGGTASRPRVADIVAAAPAALDQITTFCLRAATSTPGVPGMTRSPGDVLRSTS